MRKGTEEEEVRHDAKQKVPAAQTQDEIEQAACKMRILC
ncbi:MAG: hypothetical protein ACJA2Q_000201 [Pseudohongiellaceae bacterium]|jgi:hypothetical protein